MPNETQQPFQGDQPRKTDDTKLVAEVLGTKEAAEMGELLGQTEQSESVSVATGLDLSIDEQQGIADREKPVDLEEVKSRFIDWASEMEHGEEWVLENFIFNPDGTVDTKGDLSIHRTSVEYFPKELKRINGNLHVYYIREGKVLNNLKGAVISGQIVMRAQTYFGLPPDLNCAGVKILYNGVNEGQAAHYAQGDLKSKGYKNVKLEDIKR